jgi:hypothetical protein
MKKTISQYEFIDAMRDSNSFTYDGLVELYDYLDGIESEYEFDATETRSMFSQMSIDEFLAAYNLTDRVKPNFLPIEKAEIAANHILMDGFWFAIVENNTSIIFEDF